MLLNEVGAQSFMDQKDKEGKEYKYDMLGLSDKERQEIDKARLDANPQANLCLSCKEKEEKGTWLKIKKLFRR